MIAGVDAVADDKESEQTFSFFNICLIDLKIIVTYFIIQILIFLIANQL